MKEKHPGGRPNAEVNREQVIKLAMLQCSFEEIAAFFGCNKSTISRRFREDVENGRTQGKASLRRKQYEMAMNGNISMLIWLGKNYLDQSEKVDANLQQRILQVVGMKPIKNDRDSSNPSES
jgi:hypothetical protein